MEGDLGEGGRQPPASISIHTLRMEGDGGSIRKRSNGVWISIHTLRMEGDDDPGDTVQHRPISIHTLRMEGDIRVLALLQQLYYFNPHPPYGG